MKNILIILCLFCISCSTVPLTGRKQLNLVSNQDILVSSFQQYDEYIRSAPISQDKQKTDMVVKVGKRIAAAVEQHMKNIGQTNQIADYQWEFRLIASNDANAFCMPGGKIVVYEGILPYTVDEAGLAVVIGHEVAHAVAKHSNERMSQQVLMSVGGEFVNLAVGQKSTVLRELAPAVYGLGSQYAVMLPYSREHEYEADYLGIIFMAMAGYDPGSAETFWIRMSQQGAGGKVPEFMSTHPSDENRIRKIRERLPEARKHYKPVF